MKKDMKKTIVLALLALLGMAQAAAQDHEYVPFVREGVKWVYYIESTSNYINYYALELKGDTVLGGKTYKVMRKYSGSAIFHDDGVVPVCLREENKVVYGIVPDGKTDPDCPVGFAGDTTMQQAIKSGQEFVLYDFNEPVEFLKEKTLANNYDVIHDKFNVAGHSANRYFSYIGYCMIEGIGYDNIKNAYPLGITKGIFYDPTPTPTVYLSHVIENGKVIYRSERYKKRSTLESTMPIMQEGVKWVNERVVVSNGDTTRTRYTYEFKGSLQSGGNNFALCYRYEGEELDENATFVAYLQEYFAPNITGDRIRCNRLVETFENEPLNRTVAEGRNMIRQPQSTNLVDRNHLYLFSGDYSDVISIPNHFIISQKEDFLSRENFVEVQPLVIGEDCCRRFAYLGEDGQPLAYVIEGIGFDSRDMGDLLTPFTRKPDPDADYQEWCGLSHVIKDGQIIYKGMRYSEQSTNGDVDGDQIVNINDVTQLINHLLNSDDSLNDNLNFDVNGDRYVNISDVADLINILLTK